MAETLTTHGVLSAAGQDVRLGLAGMGGVAIQIQGTFTGTITFEATVQGQAFAPFRVVPSDSSTAVTTATAPGLWTGSTVGYLVVRARMSAFTSGQATVLMQAYLASPGGGGSGGGVGSDVNLIEVGGSSIALGETTMANSLPVVIASDQTPIPVTGSISATNPSVGPTGDPVPAEATYIAFIEPGGDLTGIAASNLDYDSGAGVVAQTIFGIALPGSGGPVAGGTATNPIVVGQATAANLNATVVGTGTFAVQVSSSALPTGAATLAEQQTQTTALQIMDDWDESDRAKVNPIVGQAGVQGGAGASTALTQRVAIATDANAVSVASLPLPTGAATLAEQQTQTTALSAIQTAVEIMDDWDESDRAKVNLIVGQAGIAAGTGTDGVTVPRVTLATNVALPAGNNNIGDVDAIQSGTWNIGTVTTVSTVTALGAGTTGPMKAEDVAHATGDQGFPAWGVSQTTPNAAYGATGDYTPISVTTTGAVRTAPVSEDFAVLANGPQVKKYYTNAGAVTDGIVWSPAGGTRWYVTDIFVGVSAASTVTLEDDLSGGDSPVFKMEFAANSGWSHKFETPLFSGEDAADLLVTTSAGNVYITITGYEI